VLLASGTAIAIRLLRPGDKVLATNVKAVIVEHDTDLYDLTVKVRGRTALIQTTARHRFWDQTTRRWTFADALSAGDLLRTGGHAEVSVIGGYVPADATGWMWDLTVASDHDFYIDVATAAVLVHNCPMMKGESRIARAMNLTRRQVADAIHAVKSQGGWRGPGSMRNPDVFVDTDTGEVYPQLPGGESADDSIGNILDYLEGE
jgi:hypothetical protein